MLHELPLGNDVLMARDKGIAEREADEAVRQFVWAHVNESAAEQRVDTDAAMPYRPPDANTSLLLVNTAYFRGEQTFFS